MESLFLALWNRSVAAGWLILAVVLVRLLWRDGPKWARRLLWLLVGVRLLCPFALESRLSLVPSAETVPQTALSGPTLEIHTGLLMVNSYVNGYLNDHYYEGVTVPERAARRTAEVCAALWITGMGAMGLWAAAGWLRLRRRVAEAVPEEDGVWLCDQVNTPFLLGLRRPRIYLPVGLSEADREFVLAHERAHLRRRDQWVKPGAFLVLAVYWFNPLVWLAYGLFCRDVELACDEAVIREMDGEGRRAYSQTLVRCSAGLGMTATCPLAFGETGVRERVRGILGYRRPALWTAGAAALLCVLAAVCFLTNPAAKQAAPYGEGKRWTAGALLYEDLALSFRPVDGGHYGVIQYDGASLALRQTGQTVTARYVLAETRYLVREDLYRLLPQLAEQETYAGRLLAPRDAQSLTVRLFTPEHPQGDSGGLSVWELTLADNSRQLWLGEGGLAPLRLYALLDLDQVLPKGGDSVLWTYLPLQSDLLPVRFDMAAELTAEAGELAADPGLGPWIWHVSMEAEAGQMVYWQPGTVLSYTLSSPEDPKQADQGQLRLQKISEGGLFGGITCLLSSSRADVVLGVDEESGALTVRVGGSGEGRPSRPGDSVRFVRGRGRVTAADADLEAAQ